MKKIVACIFVGMIIVTLCSCLSTDYKEEEEKRTRQELSVVITELEEKAQAGDINAQTGLGGIYSIGQGVEQDYEKAAKWYHKGADSETVSVYRSV